jgi:hypothetical protein
MTDGPAAIVTSMGRLSAARDRVQILERELAAAREQLHSIDYEAEQQPPSAVSRAADSDVTKDPTHGEKLALFRSRFAGRDDAYALPWVSRRTGKKGWSPAVRTADGHARDGFATSRDRGSS